MIDWALINSILISYENIFVFRIANTFWSIICTHSQLTPTFVFTNAFILWSFHPQRVRLEMNIFQESIVEVTLPFPLLSLKSAQFVWSLNVKIIVKDVSL